MSLRFTLLGCGSSPGVPRPNGDWGACDPSEPKNRRRRAALLIERRSEDGTTKVVVDTGPDFRAQCLDARVDRLDGVVFTHPHADHIHGIDDLRTFVLVSRARMPVWADDNTFARIVDGFSYCFERPAGSDYPPICERNPIDHDRPFAVSGPGGPIEFLPLPQEHGAIRSLGFRIGNVAYCPDVSAVPDGTRERMTGLDVLIIDALQYRSHPSHFSVREALAFARTVQPKRMITTHMHTPLDYRTLAEELPDWAEPGYDGMVVHAD